MREIVFDTETTGLDPYNDRIIEIGAVEIVNLIPTGNTFHVYINPRREVSPAAFKVHGISNEFLYNKPTFDKVIDDFIDFIGDDPLVAHNAMFDVAFFREELKRLRHPPFLNPIVDTLDVAKEVKKGGLHSLDVMCRHYGIDKSKRTFHGALLDAQLLAEVYLHLRGGRQFGMELVVDNTKETRAEDSQYGQRKFVSRITSQELGAHAAFVSKLTKDKPPIWASYLMEEQQQEAA